MTTYGSMRKDQKMGGRGRKIRIQDHPQLHTKFEDSLNYMRPCLKSKTKHVIQNKQM